MIVPMKKVHVVVQKKDIVAALENLRDLGTVHVEHQEALTGYQLTERREEVKILMQALEILKQNKVSVEQKLCTDWTESVNKVLELSAEIERYTESMFKRQTLISQWDVWGDFNPKDIRDLENKGFYVQLCECSVKEYVDPPEGVILEDIGMVGGVKRMVAIMQEKCELPFTIVALPSMGLLEMRLLQKQEQEKVEQIRQKIQEEACYVQSLEKSMAECQSILEFEEVEKGMREDGELALLKGFCPANTAEAIEQKVK
ncbi:hypothetical protein MNBD_UNCLBAC01-732, partial [hydrothermal vent metagenome]